MTLNPKQRKPLHYMNEGVSVYRVPILKVIPMGSYGKGRLAGQLKKIAGILEANAFIPDVIAAHAENPQVYQLHELKKRYPEAVTSLVFHGVEYLNRPGFREWKESYFPEIDHIGFRSENILRRAKAVLGFNRDYFMCPSGIANQYILKNIPEKNVPVRKFIYVGNLIERKHLKTLIEALARYPERGYELTVIGDGPQKDEDEALARESGVKARFHGKLPHPDVIKEMRKADCFVMVSTGEAFGLVYLEAMAQGCITVASEKEGMEGIIESGKNGYLCKAGDTDSLSAVLDKLEALGDAQRNALRRAALKLAAEYSETNAAVNYLKHLTL